MKQKLSQLGAPALAGVVKEKSIGVAIAEIKSRSYDGATIIDRYLSCQEDANTDALKKIIDSTNLPILA